MKWLERIPALPLATAAVVMALAPFKPEPHVVEKIRMLADGTLHRPLDIFDLLFHLLPAILLVAKVVAARRQKKQLPAGRN